MLEQPNVWTVDICIVLSAPDGPHVGPMNLAIREVQYVTNILCDVEAKS